VYHGATVSHVDRPNERESGATSESLEETGLRFELGCEVAAGEPDFDLGTGGYIGPGIHLSRSVMAD